MKLLDVIEFYDKQMNTIDIIYLELEEELISKDKPVDDLEENYKKLIKILQDKKDLYKTNDDMKNDILIQVEYDTSTLSYENVLYGKIENPFEDTILEEYHNDFRFILGVKFFEVVSLNDLIKIKEKSKICLVLNNATVIIMIDVTSDFLNHCSIKSRKMIIENKKEKIKKRIDDDSYLIIDSKYNNIISEYKCNHLMSNNHVKVELYLKNKYSIDLNNTEIIKFFVIN